MRCLSRLRLIRQAAAGTPGAEEFCARFDAVEQARAVPGTLPGSGMPDVESGIPALSRPQRELAAAPITGGKPLGPCAGGS